MRTEILTERERTILKQFLESNVKLDRVLKMRIRKNHARLREDLELVEQALKKFQ